jgi:hypothetical protein
VLLYLFLFCIGFDVFLTELLFLVLLQFLELVVVDTRLYVNCLVAVENDGGQKEECAHNQGAN